MCEVCSQDREKTSWSKVGRMFVGYDRQLGSTSFQSVNSFFLESGGEMVSEFLQQYSPTKQVTQRNHLLYKEDVIV